MHSSDRGIEWPLYSRIAHFRYQAIADQSAMIFTPPPLGLVYMSTDTRLRRLNCKKNKGPAGNISIPPGRICQPQKSVDDANSRDKGLGSLGGRI